MTRHAVSMLAAMLLGTAVTLAGEISGVLRPADRVSAVTAVDRATKKTFTAAYDRTTGKYHFRNLPNATYDLVLETTAGRIEGVDLTVDQVAPTAKPTKLTPAELDKGEIEGIAAYLLKICKDRKQVTPAFDAILASVRETKMKAVHLVKGKPGGEALVPFAVPLKKDEVPQVSDYLLGLITLARVRDALPRDFDLLLETPGGKASMVYVIPVAPELTAADRKWLIDWVNNLKIFENKKRVLDLDGTGERARVLVEKIRDRKTSLPVKEPTAFWRIEIFDFKKYYGGWNKEKYTVIVRQRVAVRTFRTYRWMFDKRLGGIRVSATGVVTVPDYEVPETLDPARGRVPF